MRLTEGRLLARNVVWNLLGQALPLAVAVFAIPVLVHGLGTDRFGLLTVAWVIVGYFSVFDLGLGRALTQIVAQRVAEQSDEDTVAQVIRSAMLIMAGLGVVGLIVLSLISPWLVGKVLKVPAAIQGEALHSFVLLALSVPVVVTTTGLRGVLEAKQRFDLINVVRIPLGLVTYLGPLLVLPLSHNLSMVVTVLVGGRLVAWLAHIVMCLCVVPPLRTGTSIDRDATIQLFRFGSWMTVSNVVGPMMVYLDRFVIGAVVSVAAVAYYATPYEMITKLWVVPVSLSGVLFPAFAATVHSDSAAASQLFVRGVKYTFAVLFPPVLLAVSFAHEVLSRWIDPNFASHSAAVLQMLAIGVFVNSLAHIPVALVQGAGRPDFTARLHVVELPLYLLALWMLLSSVGIAGVALAWLIRVSADAIVLFWFCCRVTPVSKATMTRGCMSLLLAIASMVLGALLPLNVRLVMTPATLTAFVIGSWFVVLSANERAVGVNRLRRATLPR